jgi:hypothetical protein
MCEINPRKKAFFVIEAFSAFDDPEFDSLVARALVEMEIRLNESGRVRFHIHPMEEGDPQ